MEKIKPFLWFDSQAEEAVRFYTSIFKNSKIRNTVRHSEASARMSGKPVHSVMTIDFELNGQEFIAVNGGPAFKFNEAVSFVVQCEDQQELDEIWSKLTDGGEEVHCGWLKDRFGVSWQVVPRVLNEMLRDPDPAKTGRVMEALLKMVKLDIAELKRASEGDAG